MWLLLSFFEWSAVLAIAFHCKCPILSVFVSKQSAVAAAGSMKRITCCAVEDFSCKRPAWHWVFTTTNIKPFHETHSLKPYFAAQSVMESTKTWIYMKMSGCEERFPTHMRHSLNVFNVFFLLNAHFSGQSCLLFFYSQKCVFFSSLFWLERRVHDCKRVTPLPAVFLLSHSTFTTFLVSLCSLNSTFSARWTSRASRGL